MSTAKRIDEHSNEFENYEICEIDINSHRILSNDFRKKGKLSFVRFFLFEGQPPPVMSLQKKTHNGHEHYVRDHSFCFNYYVNTKNINRIFEEKKIDTIPLIFKLLSEFWYENFFLIKLCHMKYVNVAENKF